jgi:hypothetical protein
MIAMRFPKRCVDMAFTVERRDKFVAVLCRALGKLLGSGEVEPDALE